MRNHARISLLLVALLGMAWPRVAEAGEPLPPPSYSMNGAAALDGCSGALFRFAGQSLDDRALVLTNGHCIGFLEPYEVLVGVPTERAVAFYNADGSKGTDHLATEVVYATMYQTDMAVLRMNVSYQQLADDENVDALVLASGHPAAGIDIVVVSGFWNYTTQCVLDGFVDSMREQRWTWSDSLRYSDACVTFGGTSGSPVVSVSSNEIVGVNNTGYEGGEPCSLNNPCEIDAEGNITTVTDGSYGQQTYQLYGCVDGGFELDLSRPGCQLPVPRGVLQVVGAELMSDHDCDGDGNVDAGDTGWLRITLYNDGPVDLTDTTVSVSTSSTSLTIDAGTSVPVNTVPGLGTQTVDIPIALADDVIATTQLTISIDADDSESAETPVSGTSVVRVHFDDLPNSSTTDDVESARTPWTTSSDNPDASWSRETDASGTNTVWHAVDYDGMSDVRLVSPVLEVGTDPLVLHLTHRYAFEASASSPMDPLTYWDGAVIEVSADGGATWQDASTYATMPYGGLITDQSGNPLALRDAFVDRNPSWPDTDELSIDFGTALAGQSVLLRLRVGTDAGAGAFGWQIDDVSVDGITNTPFTTIADDPGSCSPDPDPDPDPASEPQGCGCQGSKSPDAPTWLLGLLLAALALRRHN